MYFNNITNCYFTTTSYNIIASSMMLVPSTLTLFSLSLLTERMNSHNIVDVSQNERWCFCFHDVFLFFMCRWYAYIVLKCLHLKCTYKIMLILPFDWLFFLSCYHRHDHRWSLCGDLCYFCGKSKWCIDRHFIVLGKSNNVIQSFMKYRKKRGSIVINGQ